MHEWSILFFTLFIQASIGIAALSMLFFIKKITLANEGKAYFVTPLSIAFLLAALGMLLSLGHLGVPLKAPNAMLNFLSSWLSREIILSALYIAMLGVCCFLIYSQKAIRYLPSLLFITLAFGLLSLYAMASVYRNTSVVTWMPFNTTLSFFISALNLGGAFVLCYFFKHFIASSTLLRQAIIFISFLAICLILLLILQPNYMVFIQNSLFVDNQLFAADPVTIYMSNLPLVYTRFALSGAGIVLLYFSVAQKHNFVLYLGACLIVLSEVIGRYNFYNIYM